MPLSLKYQHRLVAFSRRQKENSHITKNCRLNKLIENDTVSNSYHSVSGN